MTALKGFSLIELLSVLVIGLMVVLMAETLYFHVKKSSVLQMAFSEVQENGRFASYILKTHIEQAGLIGSARFSKLFPMNYYGVSQDKLMTDQNHMMVFHGTEKHLIPTLFKDSRFVSKNNSDIIAVRSMSAVTNRLIKLNGQHLVTELNPKFQVSDNLIISDEQQAVLVHVKSVSFDEQKQYLLLSQEVKEQFPEGAEIGKMNRFLFFIEETSRKNKVGEKIDALYMLGENDIKVELVPNIIDLKAKCFRRLNQQFNEINPHVTQDWSQIVAIQIDLLLRSEDVVFDRPKKYWFDGQQLQSRYLHQVFRVLIPLMEHG